MSDNKKYYYLKVRDNFYDSEEIIVIESMPDGMLYSNILMKLYLKSLKTNGRLMCRSHIPYSVEMLAPIVRHPVAVVEKAIKLFVEMGLIEILDNGAIYMLDIQNYIGISSTEGDRKRLYRSKIEAEKKTLLLEANNTSQTVYNCEVSVNSSDKDAYIAINSDKKQEWDICPPEIRDKEIRDKKEIIKEKDQKPRKIKRPYGKYQNVMLTDIQLEKLKAEHPETYTYWIEECSSYCDSKDVSYSDYLRTIRNWINKSPKKEEYFKKLAEENKPKVKKAPSRYYEYFEEARNRKDNMSEEGWSKPLIYHAASEINWTNDLNAERNLFFARISFLEKMNIVM